MSRLEDTANNYALRVTDQATPYLTGIDVTHGNFQSVTGLPYYVSPSGVEAELASSRSATFKDTVFKVTDDANTTKSFQFQVSGVTAGQNRIYTVPDYNATLATLAGAEALSNKAIATSTLDSSVIGGVTPAAGTFTTLAGTTGTFTDIVNITKTTQQLSLNYDGSNKVAFTVDSTGRLNITPTGGRIGINTAPLANQVLRVSDASSDPSASYFGVNSVPTVTLTANNASNIQAAQSALTLALGGFTASATIRGGQTDVIITGAGTISGAVVGQSSNLQNQGTATITTAYGYVVFTPTNSGTLTTYTGMRLSPLTVAANNIYLLMGTNTPPSGNWTIHATTTNDSALAGKLKLGATTAPGTTLDVLTSDAVTAAVTNVVTIGHDSSGTPTANYGTGASIQGKSSTTAGQSMGDIQWIWTTATHASRKARGTLTAYDTAVRTCIQWEASGTAAMIGFLGTAPIVQTTAYTQTYATSSHTTANPTATSVVTTGAALASYGYTQAQADDIVTELNRLITDVANAKNNINAIIDDIQAYGLFG